MSNSFVIVAIPSQNDYTWDISSEKKPHITLLYVDSSLEDIDRVSDFVARATQSLNKFMLFVDHRGVLGEKSADVLFFEESPMIDRLRDFRSVLLTNDDLNRAYQTTEQYPTWVPHLTLGYPETPARRDTSPNAHEITWVEFDRIALWTQEYEGPEFQLKSIFGGEIAMSALSPPEAFDIDAFIEHHGIKGQKWGVLRKGLKTVSPSDDHVKASVVRGKAKLAGVHTLSNKDLQTLIKRMDLEVKFKDLKTVQHEQSLLGKGAKWAGRVATDILVNSVSSWFRAPWSRGASSSHRSSGSHGRVIDGSVVPQRQLGS